MEFFTGCKFLLKRSELLTLLGNWPRLARALKCAVAQERSANKGACPPLYHGILHAVFAFSPLAMSMTRLREDACGRAVVLTQTSFALLLQKLAVFDARGTHTEQVLGQCNL